MCDKNAKECDGKKVQDAPHFDLDDNFPASSEKPSCYSTPKATDKSASSRNEETPKCIIKNPFEADEEEVINRLLQPIVSPSLFAKPKESDSKESSEPFWSIEHISLLNPADIDCSSIHLQESGIKFDSEFEKRAQKSIHYFFENNMNIPSPYPSFPKGKSKSQLPKGSLLAVFSPSPRTRNYSSTSSSNLQGSACKMETSVQITPQATSTKSARYPSFRTSSTDKTTISTQTNVSIPPDVDMSELLAKYTNEENSEPYQDNDSTNSGNSSLRRRLFSQNDENDYGMSMLSPPPFSSQNMLSPDGRQQKTNFSRLFKSPPPEQTYSTTPSKYSESPLSASAAGSKRLQDLGTPHRQTKRMSPIDERFGEENFKFNNMMTPPKSVAGRLAESSHRFDALDMASPGLSPICKKE